MSLASDSKGNSDNDVIHWRVDTLERHLDKLTRDVAALNKVMYMVIGAMTLVQVILPLLDRYGGG